MNKKQKNNVIYWSLGTIGFFLIISSIFIMSIKEEALSPGSICLSGSIGCLNDNLYKCIAPSAGILEWEIDLTRCDKCRFFSGSYITNENRESMVEKYGSIKEALCLYKEDCWNVNNDCIHEIKFNCGLNSGEYDNYYDCSQTLNSLNKQKKYLNEGGWYFNIIRDDKTLKYFCVFSRELLNGFQTENECKEKLEIHKIKLEEQKIIATNEIEKENDEIVKLIKETKNYSVLVISLISIGILLIIISIIFIIYRRIK